MSESEEENESEVEEENEENEESGEDDQEEIDEDDIRDTIENAIYNFESRALVRDVKVNVKPDNHDVSVTVVFQVVSTSKIETLNISLTRLR